MKETNAGPGVKGKTGSLKLLPFSATGKRKSRTPHLQLLKKTGAMQITYKVPCFSSLQKLASPSLGPAFKLGVFILFPLF